MSERLLTIDVQAAWRKVSIGRLRNADQVPLALARCLAGLAPGALRIRLRRSRLQLEAASRPLGPEAFELLERLFDHRRDELERHTALERLEVLGLLDLLVAFTAGAKTVLVQAGPPTSLRLIARSDQVLLDSLPAGSGFEGNLLVLTGLEGNPGRQLSELEEHLRFAPFAVEVNRTRVDRGLHLGGVALQRAFAVGPVEGLVGLPMEGRAARTRLVVDGVVTRQVWDSPPSGAVWEAVVRCPAGFDQRALAEVSRQVAELYREIAGRYAGLLGPVQERLRQLVFGLADGGAGARAVAGIPIFRRVGAGGVDPDALRAAAQGRVIRAIGPGARPERYDLSGQVFVLDERDRTFIERHLGLQVREPARRPSKVLRLASLLARARERLGRGLRAGIRRLALGRAIGPDDLSPAEAAFLDSVQAALDQGVVSGQRRTRAVFCRGGLAGWRWSVDEGGAAWLQIGRANRVVRQMVAAFAREPGSLFPALVLLGDGRDDLFASRAAAEGLAGLTAAGGDNTLGTAE